MCPNQKEGDLYVYGTLFILLDAIEGSACAGNFSVTSYKLPTEPVEKPPCDTKANAISCLQDGEETQMNILDEDGVEVMHSYSYTFCKLRNADELNKNDFFQLDVSNCRCWFMFLVEMQTCGSHKCLGQMALKAIWMRSQDEEIPHG
jgi:hypothetical protein